MRVFISPNYNRPDNADGGIRRVVEAQKKYLPEFGWNVVEKIEDADLVALHAGTWYDKVPRSIPIVNHSHGLYWEGYEWQKWHHELNKQVIYSIMHADAVTSPSEWVSNALRRNFAIKPTTLYHGIEASDWRFNGDVGATNGGYVLWNKARVDAICDPEPVRELAKRATGTKFITTFLDGVVPANVEVTGAVPYEQAKAYIENAGVYLATTRETFGVGTLEAMASGVPILGWDFAGQREIVRHKETGWLAPVGDYDSLAEGLFWCLNNRRVIGGLARREIEERWTWHGAIERYAKLYNSVVNRKQQENVSPRTSVVVTNYNLGAYLPACIDSILAQTDQDFEVVLVDDASSEQESRDEALAQARRDDRIKLIAHDSNKYLAESLNDGVRYSNGRYILPLDADNTIAPNTLEILAGQLDEDRDVDIAYGAVRFLREDGSTIESKWPPTKFDLHSQLNHKNQIPSTSLYRRNVWERVGGYRARCKTAEDADFWCRATSFGAQPKKVTDAITLIYLDRGDSMSHVEKDWPWEAWCTWGFLDYDYLTPPAAPTTARKRIIAAETPVVSIVIPVGPLHTRAVFDALDSIRAQTFEAWEVVVVNDANGNLDELPTWAKVVDQGNFLHSVSAARNEGMLYVRGKYFLFLDADDYLEPTALEKMMGAIRDLKEDEFVYSDWIIEEEHRIVQAKEYDCKGLLRQLEYPVTALYPRSAWYKSGGFDEAFTEAWEDWDFALRIAKAGYCGVRLPEPLLHYRMSRGARRERGYERREDLKKLVYDKWKPYIEGELELMACGSCGGRRAPQQVVLQSYPSGSQSHDGMTLLEYIGPSQTPLVFRGQATGKNYRFGLDTDYRQKYVFNADVEHFLSMVEVFKRAAVGEPALV